ncbi:MAG: hypothetical protein V1889_02875 [archaeon]
MRKKESPFIKWLNILSKEEVAGAMSTPVFNNNYKEPLIQLYSAYQNYLLVQKTKWLVWVTWALAIGTLLVLIFK